MKLSKSRKYLLLKWLIVMVGFFSLHACKTKNADCFQTVIVLNSTYFKARDFRIDTLRSADSLTVKQDTVPIFNDTNLVSPTFLYIKTSASDSSYGVINSGRNFLVAPLNPSTDSIKYRFQADTSLAVYDTITFFYSPVAHFINNACGYTYYYNLSKVTTTKNMLDSAAIITPLVTGSNTGNVGNVNVYFKLNN